MHPASDKSSHSIVPRGICLYFEVVWSVA